MRVHSSHYERVTIMNYKLCQKMRKNGSLSHASVSAPPPQGALGTGSWSKQSSVHPYASTPPSKRGTRIKRNTSDQFCTRKSCSEPRAYTVQSLRITEKPDGDIHITPKLESGHSSKSAPDKYVGQYYRQPQPKNGRITDLGQHPCNGNKLTESRAVEALRKLAASKLEKREREQWKKEQDARELKNQRKHEKRALEANSLENAFKR